LNTFAAKVNLDPNQILQQFHELVTDGFLKRVGNGYSITEKGKAALKVSAPVPENMGFHFYLVMDKPTDLTAKTLEEFYRIIKQVSVDSLEFHLYRGDFERWLKEACKEPDLADQAECMKTAGIMGEDVRDGLLRVLDAKYSIRELL